MNQRGIGTRSVHGTEVPRPGPINKPIVQSSTFVFDSAAEMHRYLEGHDDLYLYTRYGNPTLRALEQALAALEEAEQGLVFASGMAAMSCALLSLLRAGDEVVLSSSLYGGTFHLAKDLLPRLGIVSRFVAPAELCRLDRLVTPRSRVLVFETPTNPMLDILDIQAVCRSAHAAGLVVVFDNTFATPILQKPLARGADLVMHSLTKALAGHSDIIGGALVGPRERIDKARELRQLLGGCLDPHPAFLALRGLKTLHLRVRRQCENALSLARHLEGHSKIRRVHHPGLASHPGHQVAVSQMDDFGGMVTFVLEGGLPAAERFYDGVRLVARAASLGGVETLVCLPLHTSHHGLTDEQLQTAGVDPGTVRMSLGVEDAADLLADVDRALDGV